MSEETLSVQVWNLLLRFRKTVWFRVTYLVLLGLIVPNLLPFTAGGLGCLVIVLVPLAVFLVPYYLGERSVRHFAVNALPVILIAVLVGGAQSTNLLLSQPRAVPLSSVPGPFASPTMALAIKKKRKVEARPPANVATLQNRMPIAMMALRLKRSAKKPKGTLPTARTTKRKVCNEPSSASVTWR